MSVKQLENGVITMYAGQVIKRVIMLSIRDDILYSRRWVGYEKVEEKEVKKKK